MTAKGFRTLKVYQLAYSLAIEVFQETKKFPAHERFDLTDQLRRSSRSVPRNIAEAYRKRAYPRHFFQKLTDASAEGSETEVSLDMALDFEYMTAKTHARFIERYDEVQRMIHGMLNKPESFWTSTTPPASTRH